MLPLRISGRKTKNVLLLQIYAKYKREFLIPGVKKRKIWKEIAREMTERDSFNHYSELHCCNKVKELRRKYEKIKYLPATDGEMVDFKIAAKNAFTNIENPVTFVPNKVTETVKRNKIKTAWFMKKQLKKERLFERNIALLTIYRLHKDEFTFHVNVGSIWKKIAEKLNEKFPNCETTPIQCRDKVLFMKKRYERMKNQNSKEITVTNDTIFLIEAKLTFETKENPVTFMDEHKKEKLLAPLKAFNMHKAEFLSPEADQQEVWKKIAETEQKLSLRNKPYSVPDFRNVFRSQQFKYNKLKVNKTDITTAEDAIFFEEAKLVFESTGSEAIPFDQILHENGSERGKHRYERRLALLRAYNIYKTEFSSPVEDDESVWEKIAGTVRISCSFNRWTINDCRLQISQIREKYEKKRRDFYYVTPSEASILFEEEKLAFEEPEFPEEHEQMDLLTDININSV